MKTIYFFRRKADAFKEKCINYYNKKRLHLRERLIDIHKKAIENLGSEVVFVKLSNSFNEVNGIFVEGAGDKFKIYSCSKIPQEYKDFMTGEFSDLNSTLEAIFIVSDNKFENLKDIDDICWRLTVSPILYIDTIIINSITETELVYDVISDLIIEDAIQKHAKTLRIGMKESSKIADVLLDDKRYIWVGADNEYHFFEVDIEKQEANIEAQESSSDVYRK